MEQTNSTQPTKNNNIWTWVVLIAIPAIILVYIAMNRASEPQLQVANNTVMEEKADTTNSVSGNSATNETPVETVVVGSYKDGTYEAQGEYVSPGGPEEVGLKITLKDGIITDSAFTKMAERPMSVTFQEQFATGYKEFVVGKKIDEVNLTKVSGSSLTPRGFNDALAKIKAEAAL